MNLFWPSLQKSIAFLCCFALAPGGPISSGAYAQGLPMPVEPAASPSPFARVQSFAQAKAAIQAAEARPALKFDGPNDDADFTTLVHANARTRFVEDPDEFLDWWQKNKSSMILQIPTMGQAVNWQIFLANVYLKYKMIKTSAQRDPSAFVDWMGGVIQNPTIKNVSYGTFGLVAGVFGFLTGVVYSAMVAGPVAGFINAFLEPLLKPIQQKGSVTGVKLFGGMGKTLNTVLFDGPTKTKVTIELEGAKSTIKDVREQMIGSSYKMTAEQWAENMKNIYTTWNHLNYVFNKLPEAYRAGRDRAADFLIFRPRDFANSVVTAINAAENSHQGVEQMLDRIMLQSSSPRDVESVGIELMQAIDEQLRSERTQPERGPEFAARVASLKARLIQLGASEYQAARVLESSRRIFVFTKHAATLLAQQLFHDAQFSDVLTETNGAFEALRDNLCLGYFHAELGNQVRDMLDQIEFKIDVEIKAIAEFEGNVEAPRAEKKLDLITKFTRGKRAARALNEAGSLARATGKTPDERVSEAVGRAGRR